MSDALRKAAQAIVDFHNAPMDEKRPDVFQRLVQGLAHALDAPPSPWLPIKDAPREDGKMCLLATMVRTPGHGLAFYYDIGNWDAHDECWIDEDGEMFIPNFCQPITPPPEAGE